MFSYGSVSSTMISCCVEAEWIRISGLSLVSFIILGDCPILEGLLKHPSRHNRLVGLFCDLLSSPAFRAMNLRLLCCEYQRVGIREGSLSFCRAYDCGKFLKDSVMPPCVSPL